MIEYPDYYKATNAAYDVLKLYDSYYPRIEIFYLLFLLRKKVFVHTYSETAQRMGISIDEFIADCAESDLGYTVYDAEKKHWIIYFNDAKSEQTIRFTVAHELGHIILEHLTDSKCHDMEANCFARNLLAPVPIREEYNFKTADECSQCFDISELAAQVALDKTPNDKYYITRENYETISLNAFISIAGYNPYEHLY